MYKVYQVRAYLCMVIRNKPLLLLDTPYTNDNNNNNMHNIIKPNE